VVPSANPKVMALQVSRRFQRRLMTSSRRCSSVIDTSFLRIASQSPTPACRVHEPSNKARGAPPALQSAPGNMFRLSTRQIPLGPAWNSSTMEERAPGLCDARYPQHLALPPLLQPEKQRQRVRAKPEDRQIQTLPSARPMRPPIISLHVCIKYMTLRDWPQAPIG
jgi:hypothetical protein